MKRNNFDSDLFNKATSMYNKRLSASLDLQPSIFFETVWSNQMMTDQGFLARFLIADCPSLAVSRVISDQRKGGTH